MSIDRRMDKEDVVYTYTMEYDSAIIYIYTMEYYSAIKIMQ